MDRTAPRPDMSWELSPAVRTPHLGPVLRVGARAIPVRDITGYIGSADNDTDKKPAFATLAVFGLATMFFLLGVLDLGLRTRFLLGAVLFGIIGLSALHDLAWLTTSTIYRVEIHLASGEVVRYATIHQTKQAALLNALGMSALPRQAAANDDSLVAA
jgi:hypothetical protein